MAEYSPGVKIAINIILELWKNGKSLKIEKYTKCSAQKLHASRASTWTSKKKKISSSFFAPAGSSLMI